eukprot:3521184-Prymnesium_polylepis.1
MDAEVWRLVIEQAVAASSGTAPSPMVALLGRVWAATPPDAVNVSPPVVTAPKVPPTIGLGASTGSIPASEGPWGVVMTQPEKDALDADMRKDLRDQEAP